MRRSRFLAAVAAAVSFVVVTGSVRAQEATTQIGFVAAVGEGTVLVSNLPIGQPGGRMMMIQKEGAAGESKGGEAQATFTMKKEDGKEAAAGKPVEAAGEGKVITLSREDAEKMKGMWVQADPSAKPAPRAEGAGEKVAFTEFHVTADTERPAELAPGTKVKVTYTVEGERKLARKIAIVKE
jgi:hypothetical protein